MNSEMQSSLIQLADYDYALPPESIAQTPAQPRDSARLLVLTRDTGCHEHAQVRDLPRFLRAGDLLVVNATRVLPARLRGRKATGGAVEALLLDAAPDAAGRYRALLRTNGRLRPGLKFRCESAEATLDAELLEVLTGGEVLLSFAGAASPFSLGETPLPPYIRRPCAEVCDELHYQTIFAREAGSVAAPTAGLHFTHALLEELRRAGIACVEVVLHVGYGTFKPLRDEDLARGRLHSEPFWLPPACAEAVHRTRACGGRVVAVGTTTARVLESCAEANGRVRAGHGTTDLFLRPGSCFRAVDALLTNFHLPRSSLLLLAAAFAGREFLLAAYRAAIERDYRFYSYGDAMLIV